LGATLLEHGLLDPSTNVTGNNPILTGKIALAHLNEFADYYTRLKMMEREAEKQATCCQQDSKQGGN